MFTGRMTLATPRRPATAREKAAVIGRSALVVVLVVLVILGLVWLGQRKLIYFPDRTAVPPASEAVTGARDVTLTTADGLRLGAWLGPAAAGIRRGTVLVAP